MKEISSLYAAWQVHNMDKLNFCSPSFESTPAKSSARFLTLHEV